MQLFLFWGTFCWTFGYPQLITCHGYRISVIWNETKPLNQGIYLNLNVSLSCTIKESREGMWQEGWLTHSWFGPVDLSYKEVCHQSAAGNWGNTCELGKPLMVAPHIVCVWCFFKPTSEALFFKVHYNSKNSGSCELAQCHVLLSNCTQ